MVSANTKYLATIPALGKLVSILLAIISIGLGGHAYEKSFFNLIRKVVSFPIPNNQNQTDWFPSKEELSGVPSLQREAFFLAIVSLFLIFSVISLLCHVLNDELANTRTNKLVDIGIHAFGALLLIIAGSLMIASANAIGDFCKNLKVITDAGIKCQYQAEKVVGGVFTIFNSFLFGFLAFIGVLRINNTEVVTATP